MKQCSVFALLILSLVGYSQSSVSVRRNSNAVLDNDLQLNQFLWSYTKENLEKNEKAPMDFFAIENWRGLGNYLSVSDDGNYFAYTIDKPTGTNYWLRKSDSLVVQSTRNNWRSVFAASKPGFFTANGDLYIFQNDEILWFLQLGKSTPRYRKNVVSYKVSKHDKNEWLAYKLKNHDSNLILFNLFTGKEKLFAGVIDYSFDKSGEWLVEQTSSDSNKVRKNELLLYNLKTASERRIPFVVEYSFSENGKAFLLKTIEDTDKGTTTTLKYLSYPDGIEKAIWSTCNAKTTLNSSHLDNEGRQVVFTVQDSSGVSLWYYNNEMENAIVKTTNATSGFGERFTIIGSSNFTDNGRYIQFRLQPRSDTRTPDSDMAKVEVWDHKDLYLHYVQDKLSKRPIIYNAFINLENDKVMPLEDNGKKIYLMQGDFAVLQKYATEEYGDRFWEAGNGADNDSNWIVFLKDGSSHMLPTKAGKGNFWFSPGGRYLVYFDMEKGCHYFSYDLKNQNLKDISVNVPEKQLGFVNRFMRNKRGSGNLAAWIENDAGVLVYDNYDIWKLDLTGRKPAVNITSGFGQSNGTVLNLLGAGRYRDHIPIIKLKGSLMLQAFNILSKQSGFYRKLDLEGGEPKLVYMGNCFMNRIEGGHDSNISAEGLAPVKAKISDIWIVQRQSDKEAPNYYKTTDFKSFRSLTSFQPQVNFRWLKQELHSFRHLDGQEGQGILYKPGDFDPRKKYPVLIVLYGGFSSNLFQFPIPSYIDQAMAPGKSPVWLVNNGYLVFTPDIYTTPLKYGPSAFNVIEGAAKYLKQLPYVDGDKLGCASHSWSAKLGAYLFTHSSSFSATAISEGFLFANVINMALSKGDGISRLADVERGQDFGNLWENKEVWLDQTTVLHVDKAQSPLLLFCNKESLEDYQDQALQLFTALRRLDKDVWWLKYDNGSHTLSDLRDLRDYTIRYTQFFDHYLKEGPAPQWMTKGIPLKLKGIESRYQLDPKGSCGKDCKICKKWNAQYNKHPEMFEKPIQEWHLE